VEKDGHQHRGDVLWLGSYPGALRLGPFREGLSRTLRRRTTALAPPPHLSSIILYLPRKTRLHHQSHISTSATNGSICLAVLCVNVFHSSGFHLYFIFLAFEHGGGDVGIEQNYPAKRENPLGDQWLLAHS